MLFRAHAAGFAVILRRHPNQDEDDRNDDHQLDHRESRFEQHAAAFPQRGPARSIRDIISISNPRSNYQSEYLVPSSAVAVDFDIRRTRSCRPSSSNPDRPERHAVPIRPARSWGPWNLPQKTNLHIAAGAELYGLHQCFQVRWVPFAPDFHPNLVPVGRIFVAVDRSFISRRSRRSSASFCRMMVYFAIGNAAEDRISKMAQAIINSSSVIPVSEENGLRWIPLRSAREYEVSRQHRRTIRLRLDLQRRLAGYQRYQLLLRIFRIHLNDRQVR